MNEFVAPYKEFSRHYDLVMGDAVAPIIRASFEKSRRRYNIEFRSVADVGCGTGKLLRKLASDADVLYGVDYSPQMLREAKRNTQGAKITFFLQDVRELQLPQPVDLITCTFDTLNYLTSLDQLTKAIRQIRQNLRDGGHFIFDVITGAGEQGRRHLSQQLMLPNAIGLLQIAIDGKRRLSRVIMQWRNRHGEYNVRPKQEMHIQRWYPASLICSLLRRCGFQVRGVHDAQTYRPITSRTWWAHFVAYKPATGIGNKS